MATDGRSAQSTSAPGLESAGFVRLVTSADGDALAATGVVARALAARGTPFQVTVGRTVAERTERARTADGHDELTVAVGATDADVSRLDAPDRPATLAAVDVAGDLGSSPDPVLALSGLVAAGLEAGAGESERFLEAARDRSLIDRRPGVAVPTADPIEGLAYSTRLRAPWSGDRDATADALAAVGIDPDASGGLSTEDHRTVGSLVALDVVGDESATPRAADAIGRALAPDATPEAPFETVGGYAEVLEAAAWSDPGTGAALAMGHGARDAALSAWREHGRRAHRALDGASTGRYDGLFVVGIDDGPVEAVARMVRAYRSPEPSVLVVGDGEAAVVTDASLGASAVERIARDLGDGQVGDSPVEYDVGRRRGYLRFDASVDESAVVEAARGSL